MVMSNTIQILFIIGTFKKTKTIRIILYTYYVIPSYIAHQQEYNNFSNSTQ